MTPRDVSSVVDHNLGILGLLAGLSTGCYDAPKPECGFRCGPNLACPSDYTCASDNVCHLNGSSPGTFCGLPDGGPPGDAYSPRVVFRDPGPGGNLNPADPIFVRFDVDVGNVSIDSFFVTAGALPVNGTVSYDPGLHQATFFNSTGLPPEQQLTAVLTSDIFDPITSMPLQETQWSFFTLADMTPPSVVFVNPVTDSTGLGVGINVQVGFSEHVINVTPTTFRVSGSQPLTGVVSYDFPTKTATFNPVDQLEPNQLHMVLITQGVTDPHGNPIVNLMFLSNFTTGADTLVPSVRTTVPINNGTMIAVNTNITVTFDEPVMNVDTTSFQINGGTIPGTVTMSNGNKTATFDPTADLPAATTINVTLGTAITDTTGNALPAPFAFSFTTL